MDRKKIIYIGSLFILTVIVSITYFSYAFFTSKYEQRGKLNIVTGTLDYKLSSTLLDNTNSITLASGEKARLNIKIESLNEIASKYELFYTTTNNEIEIGYNTNHDLPTGTINKDGTKMVTVIIKNKTASQAKVTFGVEGGFTNNPLVISSGNHLSQIQGSYCEVAANTVYEFPYNGTNGTDGSAQEFTTPCSGTYKVELWGAQGGGDTNYIGGYGSYTSGQINLPITQKLYLYVGGEGNYEQEQSFNGGGAILKNPGLPCKTGGGATDVRLTSGNWNSFDSLKSRIMVAGAGGGSFDYPVNGTNYYARGGAGGGLIGYQGNKIKLSTSDLVVPSGGTQISGGTSFDETIVGGFGYGGTSTSNFGSGGGSGYYGGGRGWASDSVVTTGAGGSSFISGHFGCNAIANSSTSNNIIHTGKSIHYSGYTFTNTNMIDGSGHTWTNVDTGINNNNLMPKPEGGYYTSGTGRTGNGYARITYLDESDIEDKASMGYVISFNTNGGVVSSSTRVIKIGDPIGELPVPTKGTNYFEGWYLESNFTTKVDTTYVPNGNITLYARYGTEINMNLGGRTRGYPSDTTSYYTTKRSYNMNTYIVGLAFDNYYSPSTVTNYSLTSNSYYVVESSGYGIGIPMQLVSGNYRLICNLSSTAPNNTIFSIVKYKSDGTPSYYQKGYASSLTTVNFDFNIDSATSYEALVITGNGTNTSITASNIKLYKLD